MFYRHETGFRASECSLKLPRYGGLLEADQCPRVWQRKWAEGSSGGEIIKLLSRVANSMKMSLLHSEPDLDVRDGGIRDVASVRGGLVR